MVLTVFNWNLLLGLAISLGIYFIGLIVWIIVKRHISKKRFEKEMKEKEDDSKREN